MRKKNSFGLVLSLSLLLVFTGAYAAAPPQYIDAPPLSQVVTTHVGEVSTTKPTLLPMITWAGDFIDLLCNGNSLTTVKGSICDKEGLNIKLFKEDDIRLQLEMLLNGKTPYFRGTLGQGNRAAEVTDRDPRTKLVAFYKFSESNGGDVLIVKSNIKTAKDLCGRTIVLQAYGPHEDWMTKIVTDACGSVKNVKIKWVAGITGDLDKVNTTPGYAFRFDKSIDAAFVIKPDADALTTVSSSGTCAELCVKGARSFVSTLTADKTIADLLWVRADYLQKNRREVEKVAHAFMLSEEALANLVKNKSTQSAQYKQLFSLAAEVFIGSKTQITDAVGLYEGAKFSGFADNVSFFGDPNNLRNFQRRTAEIQTAFISIGLLSKKVALDHAKWDYNALKVGLANVSGVVAPKFDTQEVAKVIDKRQKQGRLKEGEIFSFEVYFEPNQNSFSANKYGDSFAKVAELAATYGGAVITIEGHSDPLEYLRAKKEGRQEDVLRRTIQAAKNLSLTRANAVRDSVIAYAKSKGVTLDTSQFAVVGHGVTQPKNGMCGSDPCAPKTEQEWRDNMRVEFRIIQIEAESSAFKPL